MKKQVKLLSAVMAMTMLSGVATLNQTAKAEETEPTNVFTMAKGASVRVPDVTNADVTTNDNGLRFTAYMSKDNYNAEATYGTFIMPLEYYQANPVSAETLAENYYWKTGVDADGNDVYNTTETDGKKQIINVEAIAYLDEVDYNEDKATEEMYVMNGSVRHIKGDNLALEYIGVSYAKVCDTYTFAEQTTDNARSVVEVAQKALLNAANDEAFTANELGTTEQKVTAVDGAYTARYVTKYQEDNDGAYPTVEMNVRVYKDLSSTSGFVAEDTIAKIEVPFTGYDATTTGETQTRDGYTYLAFMTEAVPVMFDGSSAEVKQYFEYTANDIVIWDGDDVLSETMFGITQYWDNVDKANPEYSAVVDEETLVFEGNSLRIKPDIDQWDGILWKSAIAKDVRYISFYVLTEKAGSFKLETRSMKADGTKTWVGGQTVEVQEGIQKVTIDLGESVQEFYGIQFKTRFNGEYLNYYIDNICIERAAYTDQSVGKIPDVFSGDFNVPTPEVKSTVYFGEDVMPTATVEYKAATASEWTIAQGTTIATTEGVNTYDVRVSVGETVLAEKTVRRGMMVATFDEAPAEKEVTVGETTFVNYAANRDYIVAADNGPYRQYDRQNGDYTFADVGKVMSLAGYDGYLLENGWDGGYIRRKMWGPIKYLNDNSTETYTKMGVWVYAASEITYTNGFYYYNAFDASGTEVGSNYFLTLNEDGTTGTSCTFKVGYHYYEFVLQGNASFNKMKTIWVDGYKGKSKIYVDQIAFLK